MVRSPSSWSVDSSKPYYILNGVSSDANGLIDLHWGTRSGGRGNWYISKDGVAKYTSVTELMCGSWTDVGGGSPAPSLPLCWQCLSNYFNYGHYMCALPMPNSPSRVSTCEQTYGVQCHKWSQEQSKCLGCAGSVGVHVHGIGAYNASLTSTCATCSCNASGIPHRSYRNRLPSEWQEFIFDNNGEPQVSYGNWTSTGDCTFDNITGSGQCDCSQRDGAVMTPEGPWISTGNCTAPGLIPSEDGDRHIGGSSFLHPDGTLWSGQFCACTNRGRVLSPKTTYNSSHDPTLSYISEWEVLFNPSLSYVTSYESSVNTSLSYPRTYTSIHNASLSYPTAWDVVHNSSLSYINTWTTGESSEKSASY